MYQTYVIARHTFREVIAQPIYTLLLGLGLTIVVIFGMLPFFTFGEDTTMYKDVTLDVIMVLVLIATLFATSKSIFDEIEDRTMLTLMSKPVRKWEVLVGKYLGINLAAAVGVLLLGVVMGVCTYMRIPGDYLMPSHPIDTQELHKLDSLRVMHLVSLVPSLILVWLEISVLAAIGVALSTRFSLVVNLPTVLLLYFAGNLTRFLYPLTDQSWAVKGLAWILSLVVPFLQTFDIRQLTLYHQLRVPGTIFSQQAGAVPLGTIAGYVGIALVYAIAYSAFALAGGLLLFQTRELGGAEG